MPEASRTGPGCGHKGNRAFVWEKGVMTELDGSAAFAINAAGEIVGVRDAGQGPRATLWTRKEALGPRGSPGCARLPHNSVTKPH